MESQRTLPVPRPEPVPRWAKIATWAVVASVVPSIAWRLDMAIGALANGDNPCADPATTSAGEWVYIIALLPIAQLSLALLTFGLIRPWGEVFPRWMPGIGGRRVPVSLAAVLATAGALGVAAFLAFAMGDHPPRDPLPAGCEQPGWDIRGHYLTMAMWPPLLLALTWHYVRRRRHAG